MIAQLILKDLRRRFRQPMGYVILLALPLLFTVLMGLVFAPRQSDDSLIQVHMMIEDHDDSFASQFITGAFGRGELQKMFEITPVDSGTGCALMDDGKASALLIIPAGFGDSLLNSHPVCLQLIKNPSESFAPKIAEETIQIFAEGGDRLLSLADGPLKILRRQLDSDRDLNELEITLISVQTYRLIRKVENVLFPPLIRLNTSTQQEEPPQSEKGTLFAYLLCNVLVMSLLFMLEVLSRDLYLEIENHTFLRQRVIIGVFRLQLAKLLFVFLTGILSFMLVWAISAPLFGIPLTLIQIIRLFLFSLILMAGLTGVISFIYALSRTRVQGQSIAPAVILGFSMLGGSMLPLENMPLFMQKIAVISPVYWGIDALHEIVLGNAGFGQISSHIYVLLLIGIGLIVPSLMIQQRKLSA